ncbi:TIGR03915 family putative DNA repair protein [Oscillibacter hominis]|uniref:TIGR03915 family putative DNA repair protein n=1 Tax=Oscillibacter hominis TaxID=2763056 RepID=A0A7G9B7Y0_9FIRM|nr:TIGR03915 family putative DNA repair protein [Oscillibacter hominis]QNL45661.1 TIGR03915 family putative DNA repair protein [Oscillibacter hominis]
MPELVYLYDGSFEGFLCCVFESYTRKEVLTAICSDEDFAPVLFATRTVETDRAHALRVYRSLIKISPQAGNLVRRGFLTCLPDREYRLYLLIRKLYRVGAPLLRRFSDEVCYPIFTAVRHLEGEAQLLRGFVRFSEFSGVLGAEIEPKNRVLPILRGHFCGRYQNETFFIYDRTHHEVLLYADRRSEIRPLNDFQMAPPDEEEASFRTLWKRFYDTIAIKERFNPKCRMTQMPKRYWNTMTEFQPPSYFKAKSSPAAVAGPAAPGGIPAPERPQAPGRSVPE